MKKFLLLIFIFTATLVTAQDKGIISGVILDKEVNNEPLAFAHVEVKGTSINTTTDLDGVHKLEVTPGVYTLVFNFPGYQKVEVSDVVVKKDRITTIKDISLEAIAITLSIPGDVGETEGASRPKK